MSTLLRRSADRLVFDTMGTAVSVTTGAGQGLSDAVCDGVRAAFDALDERFSLYRAESEATAVAERHLLLRHASPQYRDAYDLSATWTTDTDGAFTAHRPDGRIDLSGVVKALAIGAAAQVLDADGLGSWCINAGGDVLTRGAEDADRPWVVGLVDPDDRTRLVSQFTCSDTLPAIATSGIAERGEHIWRVGSSDAFTQVSVAASDIITADVLATAIVAGGPATLDLATRRWNIEVLAFGRDGSVRATGAFRA